MKTLWHGGTFVTMEREGHAVGAVLVEDGRIIATGTYEELKGRADREENVGGAEGVPGCVGKHLQPIRPGRPLLSNNLSAVA